MSNFFEEKERSLAATYRVGVYCRLSKADGDETESASIANQRAMLTGYCKQKGWYIAKIYEDDGFSGLKKDRPRLQELLADVEAGKINLVITKDYSRLGRDRLHTEELREHFFPLHKCRYIAVLDGYDSLYSGASEDIMPFKSILNEMYSRDISKKVHATYKTHAEQGLYTGCVPPLGYLKDPAQKGHLVVDPETAPIIQEIFSWAAAGKGANFIRRRLEEERIPCPTYWNRVRGFRNKFTKHELSDPESGRYIWDFSVINDILKNPCYIGVIASQKKDYRFKLGVIGEKAPVEWIQVPGCHEPLVSEADFATVQELMTRRKRPRGNGEYSIFAGLLKCGECGKSLTLKYNNAKTKSLLYACKTYNSMGRSHCSQHRIDYDVLYDTVLGEIRALAAEAFPDESETAEEVAARYRAAQVKRVDALKKQLTTTKARIDTLDAKVLKLYDDSLAGKLSDEMLSRLMDKVQQEQVQLTAQVKELEQSIEEAADFGGRYAEWLKLIHEYKDLQELTPDILHKLIKSIVVHETITDGKSEISLEIHYKISDISKEKVA